MLCSLRMRITVQFSLFKNKYSNLWKTAILWYKHNNIKPWVYVLTLCDLIQALHSQFLCLTTHFTVLLYSFNEIM